MLRPSLLLSIHPEFAEKVFTGEKSVELRRTKPRVKKGDRVLVYVSSPVKSLVGFFEVENVVNDHPDSLWTKVSQEAGVTREQFRDYYAGASEGYAIFICKRRRFRYPLNLNVLRERFAIFSPPQSYRYLEPEVTRDIIALGAYT
jgi:predicted transcriptional regulator